MSSCGWTLLLSSMLHAACSCKAAAATAQQVRRREHSVLAGDNVAMPKAAVLVGGEWPQEEQLWLDFVAFQHATAKLLQQQRGR
jgi:hypothetical protein